MKKLKLLVDFLPGVTEKEAYYNHCQKEYALAYPEQYGDSTAPV